MDFRLIPREGVHLIKNFLEEDIYEDFEIPSSIKESCKFETKVELCELLGSEYHIHLSFNDSDVIENDKVIQYNNRRFF